MPAEENDIELVRRYQRGDADAFDQLVRRHQDRVYRLAALWLYDPQTAQDAAQESFLRAMSALRGFLFRASISTWLYRMTKNVCSEMNRRQKRNTMSLPQPPGSEFLVDADHCDGPEQAQTLNAVRMAIARLPERQRDVVLLRVFEELSVADTARVMGCRPGTVKAHLSKALANLGRDAELMSDHATRAGSGL